MKPKFQKNNEERSSQIVGNAWKKKTKDGKPFISGSIKPDMLAALEQDAYNQVSFAIYPNEFKKKDTSPDFVIITAVGTGQTPQKKAPPKVETAEEDDDIWG